MPPQFGPTLTLQADTTSPMASVLQAHVVLICKLFRKEVLWGQGFGEILTEYSPSLGQDGNGPCIRRLDGDKPHRSFGVRMTNSGKKVRIYDLSRDLGLPNSCILDAAKTRSIPFKSHSSSISEGQAKTIVGHPCGRRSSDRRFGSRLQKQGRPKGDGCWTRQAWSSSTSPQAAGQTHR